MPKKQSKRGFQTQSNKLQSELKDCLLLFKEILSQDDYMDADILQQIKSQLSRIDNLQAKLIQANLPQHEAEEVGKQLEDAGQVINQILSQSNALGNPAKRKLVIKAINVYTDYKPVFSPQTQFSFTPPPKRQQPVRQTAPKKESKIKVNLPIKEKPKSTLPPAATAEDWAWGGEQWGRNSSELHTPDPGWWGQSSTPTPIPDQQKQWNWNAQPQPVANPGMNFWQNTQGQTPYHDNQGGMSWNQPSEIQLPIQQQKMQATVIKHEQGEDIWQQAKQQQQMYSSKTPWEMIKQAKQNEKEMRPKAVLQSKQFPIPESSFQAKPHTEIASNQIMPPTQMCPPQASEDNFWQQPHTMYQPGQQQIPATIHNQPPGAFIDQQPIMHQSQLTAGAKFWQQPPAMHKPESTDLQQPRQKQSVLGENLKLQPSTMMDNRQQSPVMMKNRQSGQNFWQQPPAIPLQSELARGENFWQRPPAMQTGELVLYPAEMPGQSSDRMNQLQQNIPTDHPQTNQTKQIAFSARQSAIMPQSNDIWQQASIMPNEISQQPPLMPYLTPNDIRQQPRPTDIWNQQSPSMMPQPVPNDFKQQPQLIDFWQHQSAPNDIDIWQQRPQQLAPKQQPQATDIWQHQSQRMPQSVQNDIRQKPQPTDIWQPSMMAEPIPNDIWQQQPYPIKPPQSNDIWQQPCKRTLDHSFQSPTVIHQTQRQIGADNFRQLENLHRASSSPATIPQDQPHQPYPTTIHQQPFQSKQQNILQPWQQRQDIQGESSPAINWPQPASIPNQKQQSNYSEPDFFGDQKSFQYKPQPIKDMPGLNSAEISLVQSRQSVGNIAQSPAFYPSEPKNQPFSNNQVIGNEGWLPKENQKAHKIEEDDRFDAFDELLNNMPDYPQIPPIISHQLIQPTPKSSLQKQEEIASKPFGSIFHTQQQPQNTIPQIKQSAFQTPINLFQSGHNQLTTKLPIKLDEQVDWFADAQAELKQQPPANFFFQEQQKKEKVKIKPEQDKRTEFVQPSTELQKSTFEFPNKDKPSTIKPFPKNTLRFVATQPVLVKPQQKDELNIFPQYQHIRESRLSVQPSSQKLARSKYQYLEGKPISKLINLQIERSRASCLLIHQECDSLAAEVANKNRRQNELMDQLLAYQQDLLEARSKITKPSPERQRVRWEHEYDEQVQMLKKLHLELKVQMCNLKNKRRPSQMLCQ